MIFEETYVVLIPKPNNYTNNNKISYLIGANE